MEWGTISSVTGAWQKALRQGGFEGHVRDRDDLRRVGRLTRVHRQMLRVTGLRPPASVLEVGVGGGQQLVPFALRGFRCHGVDTSADAISRFDTLANEIRRFQPVELTGAAETFPSEQPDWHFDLVFHSGVIHQILDPEERAAFHRGAANVSCGHVVAVMSSSRVGTHEISGFTPGDTVLELTAADVPAVAYTPRLLADELTAAGLREVRVLPVNIGSQWPGIVRRSLQALPRVAALNGWAGALLGVGRV